MLFINFAISHHCENCTPGRWPIFQGKQFEMLIHLKRLVLVQNAWNDFYRFWYPPSKDSIVKILLRDIDLLLEGKKIKL